MKLCKCGRGDIEGDKMIEINKIYNEDCRKTMKRMPNNSVDIVFTSPPYNRKRNDKYKHYDDTKTDYFGFLADTIIEMIRVSNGNVFVNIQKNYYNKEDVFKLFGYFSDRIAELFIWEKSNPMPNPHVINAYEFIICFGDKIKANHTYTKNHLTTSVAKMTTAHKAMMHPKVADFFIKNFTQPNDIIYDPFMGAGTTAISALKNQRRYIGSELSAEYCELANTLIKHY